MGTSRNKCLQRLSNMLILKANWDGYGAKIFTEEHINFAKKVLCQLTVNPKIYPTGRSSIQFEWETSDKYLELEIFEDNRIVCFIAHYKDGVLPESEKELEFELELKDIDRINTIVKEEMGL